MKKKEQDIDIDQRTAKAVDPVVVENEEIVDEEEVELSSKEVEEHSKNVRERYAAELQTAMLLYSN